MTSPQANAVIFPSITIRRCEMHSETPIPALHLRLLQAPSFYSTIGEMVGGFSARLNKTTEGLWALCCATLFKSSGASLFILVFINARILRCSLLLSIEHKTNTRRSITRREKASESAKVNRARGAERGSTSRYHASAVYIKSRQHG